MNDKKFIEELKFKREEYGVSQKRLAVACGISREHYNRIETGKLPLTEELKAEIQKQLERLNPLEPMFILVDYFRVRFPTTDPLTVIKDILHIKPRHMLHEEYGRYGYEEQYILGDITVLVSSNPSLGVLLELKGKPFSSKSVGIIPYISILKRWKFFKKVDYFNLFYCIFLRNSVGSIPTSSLNTRLIYLGSEYPVNSAI